MAELEATARLKIGLQRLRRNGELTALIAGTGAVSPNRTWIFAMAAGVAAVVIGVSLWFPRSGPLSTPVLASVPSAFRDHNGHSLSVLATAPLFRTRAERYDAVIELPASRGAIRLRVLPTAPTGAGPASPTAPAESARYQAALARIRDDDSSERIVAIDDLKASAEDGLCIGCPAVRVLEPEVIVDVDRGGSTRSYFAQTPLPVAARSL